MKLFRSSFFIFLLAVAITEGICFYLLPYRKASNALQSPRNSFAKRAWPEYVSAPRDPAKKLVIVIGNSQSNGEELSDSTAIYPALLARQFKDSNIVLENWSLKGLRTTDLELLSTYAILKGADLVLLALDMSNFDAFNDINISFPNTDVNLLLAEPGMWKPMQQSLLVNSFEKETLLNQLLNRHVSTIRSRTPVFGYLASDMSFNDQIFYFGNPITRELNPRLENIKEYRKRINYELKGQLDLKNRKDNIRERIKSFYLFNYYLHKRAAAGQTRFVYIWQPLCKDMLSDGQFNDISRFRKQAPAISETFGIKSYDMLFTVPDSMYYSVSHFKASGHLHYASFNATVIRHELQ